MDKDFDLTSTINLNNGVRIPRLGLGTYKMGEGDKTRNAVRWALASGYRHIDGAWYYGNEAEIGQALIESGISRDEVFITSKLWNDDHGYDNALRACVKGLERMHLEYFDLYLIHWPVRDKWRETWKAMEELLVKGLCRAIGVSNFTIEHIEDLLSFASVVHAVNQIELSPFNQKKELVDYCKSRGINIECFSPLARGRRFDDPSLTAIARKHSKSPAQVMIRWALQQGLIVLPKSATKERIEENKAIFDFHLTCEEMDMLSRLEEGYSVMRPEWVAQFEY